MKLQAQTMQLAALFDCLEDVLVWVKDREGRYRWVNRAFLLNYAMTREPGQPGVSLEDVVGKTDRDLSPAFLAEQYMQDDAYVLTGRPIVNRIELVGQPHEPGVWNVTNKTPVFDSDGAVIGSAGITRRLETPHEAMMAGNSFGPVLAHMRDHHHEPISNQQLARMAHMSVRAFERKFQSVFHLTPQKYLRTLRLRMASRALVFTKQPLAEVALRCGFVDQSHFTRAFRHQFGRTPRDYRALHGAQRAPAVSVTNSAAPEQEASFDAG
jgi:AraC-like DNA-binding protein